MRNYRMDPAELSPYLEHLRSLPFVRGVRVLKAQPSDADYEIEVRAENARVRADVELKKSHVSPLALEGWARAVRTSSARPRLLLAPAIGERLGEFLEERGIGFVDRAGNCYVNLASKHVARIQGKRAPGRAPAEKALRAPAYRALFALLAEPPLISATVRALAEAAQVSRQAAYDIRPRLQALGYVYARGTTFGWTPRGRSKALEFFVSGYTTTLRPQLVFGRYRTPGTSVEDMERKIHSAIRDTDQIRWGGGAAAMRLTRFYRGERMVLHADALTQDFLKRIKAIPSKEGPLELLRYPGPVGKRGATDDTVHPILVYAELMYEGHERAAEAAQQVLKQTMPNELDA